MVKGFIGTHVHTALVFHNGRYRDIEHGRHKYKPIGDN